MIDIEYKLTEEAEIIQEKYKISLSPRKAHETDAGFDLCSCIDTAFVLMHNSVKVIPTGVCLKLPEWWEAQIRSRSGLAAKYGIHVTNSPGTIDYGYTDEIKIILSTGPWHSITITPGMRIAQLVIKPLPPVNLVQVRDLNNISRGGFGSTGV